MIVNNTETSQLQLINMSSVPRFLDRFDAIMNLRALKDAF